MKRIPYSELKQIAIVAILSTISAFLQFLFQDNNIFEHQAIAPMLAVAGGSALLQTGMGLWQKKKADGMKVDTAKEDAAMKNMVSNQQKLIKRAKGRENTDMAGMSDAENSIKASTARSTESFRDVGGQAGYQDFLNQALQKEQESLTNLNVANSKYKLETAKDTDSAISGMSDIYATQFERGSQQTDQQKADKAAAQGTAAQNFSGAFSTLSSAGMMMAGSGGGGAEGAKGASPAKQARMENRAQKKWQRNNR